MPTDTSGWTGDGTFTPVLIAALEAVDRIEGLRVEDAPSSRAESGYNFIANEIYVTFRTEAVEQPVRRFGVLPGRKIVIRPLMSLGDLAAALGSAEGVGPPDYADDGMLQYLRAERLVAPYQTRGIKVVEMVRIYAAGSPPRPSR